MWHENLSQSWHLHPPWDMEPGSVMTGGPEKPPAFRQHACACCPLCMRAPQGVPADETGHEAHQLKHARWLATRVQSHTAKVLAGCCCGWQVAAGALRKRSSTGLIFSKTL